MMVGCGMSSLFRRLLPVTDGPGDPSYELRYDWTVNGFTVVPSGITAVPSMTACGPI